LSPVFGKPNLGDRRHQPCTIRRIVITFLLTGGMRMNHQQQCDLICKSHLLFAFEFSNSIRFTFPRMDIFSRFAGCFGFFLDPDRFAQSFCVTEPFGHPSRPSKALLSAFYLCSVAFSGSGTLTPYEPIFLSRALYHTSQAPSSTHPLNVKHALQADILIAYYFFAHGLIPEGKSHIDNAMLIATVHRAHKISRVSSVEETEVVEQREWVNGFWLVYFSDKCWSIAGGLPSLSPDGLTEETRIDSPWPIEPQKFRTVVRSKFRLFHVAVDSRLILSYADPTRTGSARIRHNQSVPRKPCFFVCRGRRVQIFHGLQSGDFV